MTSIIRCCAIIPLADVLMLLLIRPPSPRMPRGIHPPCGV
jgi:hypothetical protein